MVQHKGELRKVIDQTNERFRDKQTYFNTWSMTEVMISSDLGFPQLVEACFAVISVV